MAGASCFLTGSRLAASLRAHARATGGLEVRVVFFSIGKSSDCGTSKSMSRKTSGCTSPRRRPHPACRARRPPGPGRIAPS
eukprot:746479-Alexandrium_andersonii.AAC.1